MKILCIHQGHELYGSDRSFIGSVSLIKTSFPEATIEILIPKQGPILTELSKLGLPIKFIDLGIVTSQSVKRPLSTSWGILRKTQRALTFSRGYDFIYINTVVVLDFILASRLSKTHTLIHVREIPASLPAKLVFSLILWFSRAQIIFNSANTEQSFMLLGNKKRHVVLNGVEGFRTVPSLAAKSLSGPLKLLLIGRINSWKGHSLLLEALAGLSESKNIHLRIVGDVAEGKAQLKEALLDQIKTLGLEDSTEVHPFTNNPEQHFAWSDVVVVPSTRPEPFGRIAAEALSAGRPVIAAQHGGLVEIIKHGKNGLLFAPNQVKDLREKILYALEHKEQLKAMGDFGKKDFGERFSMTVYERTFKRALKSAYHPAGSAQPYPAKP